ncbi:MAG: methyltransferase domain-containing protein [Patescibacteria group bacterium]
MKKKINNIEASSFRDPNGFIFFIGSDLFRQINETGRQNFDFLTDSGLYQKLVEDKLLIAHEQAPEKITLSKNAYKIIKPQIIPFLSYPYEWSFTQLKDAALLTLKIQETALKYNMSLKDASAYNVQFIGCKPIFIDTLSFEKYKEDQPWIAYRQFCQHFLAPLALMAKKELHLNLLLRDFIDGIPLDLASKLLPPAAKLNFSLLAHIHLHALNQKRMADKKIDKTKFKMTKFQMVSFIDNLRSAVENLKIKKYQTEWEKYYTFTNYSDKAFKEKQLLLQQYIKKIKPKSVLDLGANTGKFSQIASETGAYTIACDIDPLAVEKAYLESKKNKNGLLLPIIIDLTNPSPALGWANRERKSFNQRASADCVIAFALIHHLAISNNLPLHLIAQYFSSLGNWLIIEFIPKEDSKVQILLQNREDVFKNYSKNDFKKSFLKYYKIIDAKNIKESEREIYLMKRK